MAQSAERSDPQLWDKVKAEVTHGDKGGEPDQWSARKAQLAVAEYKKRGGGYKGRKSADNHLTQWTQEEWGTRSGKPSGETHERYLPKEARQKLTDAEYRRTTAKKRADAAEGRQFSRQPDDVARKVAPTRSSGNKGAGSHDAPFGRKTAPRHASPTHAAAPTRTSLLAEARKRNIPGRSRMTRDQLEAALET